MAHGTPGKGILRPASDVSPYIDEGTSITYFRLSDRFFDLDSRVAGTVTGVMGTQPVASLSKPGHGCPDRQNVPSQMEGRWRSDNRAHQTNQLFVTYNTQPASCLRSSQQGGEGQGEAI